MLERDLTYAPSYKCVSVLLADPEVPVRSWRHLSGGFPVMTDKGIFIIICTDAWSGLPVDPFARCLFDAPVNRSTGRQIGYCQADPRTAAPGWIRDSQEDYLILKFNRKRSEPITIFLRALCAVKYGWGDSL